MPSDCHLTHKSLGNSTSLQSLYYVQPWCAATLYPSETLASTSVFFPPVTIIGDKDGASDSGVSLADDPALLAPASPPVPPPLSPSDLGSILVIWIHYLASLNDCYRQLLSRLP
jgi:hypothetical protein